jgi:hypothetical protein
MDLLGLFPVKSISLRRHVEDLATAVAAFDQFVEVAAMRVRTYVLVALM